MNGKTMEGLIGARTNMNLMDTPMRVYKEARRKGDMAAMERAMGYVGDFSDKAEEYKAEADKGMEEDAREAEEKAKELREEAIRKRREERSEENRNADINTEAEETKGCLLELSEEGKVLMKENLDPDGRVSAAIRADTVQEPVTYTKSGETVLAEQRANISVSV